MLPRLAPHTRHATVQKSSHFRTLDVRVAALASSSTAVLPALRSAGSTGSSSSSSSSTPPKRGRGRPPKQPAHTTVTATKRSPTSKTSASTAAAISSAAHALHIATGLPPATAERVITSAGSGVPSNAEELRQRVVQLQRLLGEDGAARALQRWPGVLGSRPELLALHLQQWLSFFGDDDPSSSSSSSSSSSGGPGLRARLAASPQLLAVDAERLVGNLYELGAMVAAEDLDTFARKSVQLALARPAVLQEKMRRLLLLLNSEGQRAAEAAGAAAAAAAAAGGAAASAAARRRTASLIAPEFSLAQLQAAARRDHRWLAMSTEALEARLTGLQQALGVSMAAAGRIFLKQPSILHKSSSLLQQRIAALQALPGMEQQQAVHVVVAFPALLNLQPEVLQERWRLLQQAAATSPLWQHQLDTMPAATLASMLPLSSSRYSRLQQVADRKQQARRTMRGLLQMPDKAYQAFAAKHLQQQQGLGAVGGVRARGGALTIFEMQQIADGLAVAPAKMTVNPIFGTRSSTSTGTNSSSTNSRATGSSEVASHDTTSNSSSSSIASSSVIGIRLRCGKADVSVRSKALTHDTLLEGLVRLCCCWSVRLQGYHLSEQQCAAIRAYVPAQKWQLHANHCRWPRML